MAPPFIRTKSISFSPLLRRGTRFPPDFGRGRGSRGRGGFREDGHFRGRPRQIRPVLPYNHHHHNQWAAMSPTRDSRKRPRTPDGSPPQRKREKQFYHQRPDISPVRGTNFSTENNDGAFFPAHSKITGPGHGESPLIKRKTPSPYNKHGENDDIGHLSRREQIPWEYRFRQPEFSPQNQRDFTGRGGRPFRGGRFRGGRARGRDFPPPAKVESLLVKKGLILGNFGTPAFHPPAYDVSPDRTAEKKSSSVSTANLDGFTDRNELFDKMMKAKRDAHLDEYYRFRDLLNAIDRGENIGGGGKNGRRRNSDSLESSGFCEPNETSETFEDEFEELEETDFCDGLEGEANEDSTFDQSTKDKNDCSIEVAEGEQCSKRRKKIEGEAEDVKYRDEKGSEEKRKKIASCGKNGGANLSAHFEEEEDDEVFIDLVEDTSFVRRETVKLRNAKQVPFSPQSKQPESDFDLTLKDAVDESFKTPLKQKITKFQEKTVLENEEIRIKMMMFQPAFVPILLASLRNSTSKREMKNSTAVTSLFEMALQKVIQTYQSREVQNIK